METARSRFLRYVTYYTTSDEYTGASPSTERQKDLGRVLLAELESLGLAGAHMDGAGNVIATLPAAAGVTAPVLALIAHMDTSPDASGENVKPRIVRYEGGDLPLSDAVSLTESLCPGLSAHAGEELIVTDGTTLLGADDKAGVAEIMTAVRAAGRTAPHGEVRVVFTHRRGDRPRRGRSGRGGASALRLRLHRGRRRLWARSSTKTSTPPPATSPVRGVGVHPGSAKDMMVNAATVAMDFHAMLPHGRGAGADRGLSRASSTCTAMSRRRDGGPSSTISSATTTATASRRARPCSTAAPTPSTPSTARAPPPPSPDRQLL